LFDIAWSELALIGAVALIVIGPKDLPRVMRSLGQWTRRARMMAAEFQRNIDEMMREAEIHEMRKEVESISPAAFKQQMEDLVGAKDIEEALKIDPSSAKASEGGPELTPGPTPEEKK
jgi:sec-independent protein translocase protein TatB